jgi:hypothetical protein
MPTAPPINYYRKMAGTAAVFVLAEKHANSPVERDGLLWDAQELHIDQSPQTLNRKLEIATTLALEGLETYDPPSHGDVRQVTALNTDFVYIGATKGWVEIH